MRRFISLARHLRTAQRTCDVRMLSLAALSNSKVLLNAEQKDKLVLLRKSTLKSGQYVRRLKRRLAKSRQLPSIPKLERSGFSKRKQYNLLVKTHGIPAAIAFLQGH